MNSKSAFGFVVVGILMAALPTLTPSFFPDNGPDGSNAGATWLLCMGVVEIAIGGFHLLRHDLVPMLRRASHARAHSRRPRVAWRTARNPLSGS
jgi:hypothetical protein